MQSRIVSIPLVNGTGLAGPVEPFLGVEWELVGWAAAADSATDGALLWYSPTPNDLQFVTPIGQYTSEGFLQPIIVAADKPLFIRALDVPGLQVKVTLQYNRRG